MGDRRAGDAGEEIVVRAGVGGRWKSRRRAMLSIGVGARRGELGPVTRLAVAKLRISYAGARLGPGLLTALRILATPRRATAHGPCRQLR